jgi:sigma-E factor negative regulatory protein RseA
MSEDIQEQLSALMDGELPRDERAFLLRRLEHDAELRAAWTRMHLMRDVLSRKQSSAPNDLADRVMQAIAEETRKAPAPRRYNTLWRPFAGAALAASVALMAVLSIRVDPPADAPLAMQPRSALPAGVPGPMLPDARGLSGGVQPVSASSSVPLRGTPALTPNDVLLLRHGQLSNSVWSVGVDHVYEVPTDVRLQPVAQ